MAYYELYNEYDTLVKEKISLQKKVNELKSGYISTKTISGKKYTYLQDRVDGKLVSEYVREYNFKSVKAELDERSCIKKIISEIDIHLDKLEAATKILDNDLNKKLINLRRCAAMESLPYEKRSKALAFSRAMTALEGIRVSTDIEEDLSCWAVGDLDFQESFFKVLQAYKLV